MCRLHVRMELDLINGRNDLGFLKETIEVFDRDIGDTFVGGRVSIYAEVSLSTYR